jgi:polar amino acid transport system substrate-binding protein
MKKRYIIILSCLFLLGMLTGCIQKDQLADGTKLIDKQKFIFAASGEFKPFSYVSNDDLSMTGFDLEVGNAVGRELGLEPVQKRMKFKGLIEGIKTGRADAAVASHTINPQRAKHVTFSTPYYYSGPQIFTRPDSKIKTVEDLKGKEVAVAKAPLIRKQPKSIPAILKCMTVILRH